MRKSGAKPPGHKGFHEFLTLAEGRTETLRSELEVAARVCSDQAISPAEPLDDLDVIMVWMAGWLCPMSMSGFAPRVTATEI